MEGYKIYNYQRDVLVQQTMEGKGKYNPVEDINGDYFIFEIEYRQCGLGVLTEYVPPTPPEAI